MPAIVELSAVERAKIIKLLDNLNLGFVFSGFGEAFVAMMDGTPVHLTADQKQELPTLINNLNLGFAHLNAGDLLVGLLDASTQQTTAKAMTAKQAADLKALLNNLNLSLHKHDVGGLVQAVIDHAHAGGTVTAKLAWDATPPTAATLGTAFTLSWKGGTGSAGQYDITGSVGTDKPVQQTVTGQTATITPDASATAGNWVFVITDNATKETITATIAVSAPAPVKTITGKGDITGKKTLDVIDADDLFTYSNTDKSGVTGVTASPNKATWNNTAKTLTIAKDASGDITLTFTVASGTNKAGTVVLKGVVKRAIGATPTPVALTTAKKNQTLTYTAAGVTGAITAGTATGADATVFAFDDSTKKVTTTATADASAVLTLSADGYNDQVIPLTFTA
ncbi:hypothetical protein MF451_003808 [Salmonella enterica subsp. enterica serovar Saintpaul]|nr:hypothetical protein [Salmonella enterica subsp. enterica serovar Saintpaul]